MRIPLVTKEYRHWGLGIIIPGLHPLVSIPVIAGMETLRSAITLNLCNNSKSTFLIDYQLHNPLPLNIPHPSPHHFTPFG